MSNFWSEFDTNQLNLLADSIMKEYRSKGFPYYTRLSPSECLLLKDTLRAKSWDSLVENDIVKQTMHGLGAIWAYFPHAFSVKCGKSKTVMEVFEDDVLFKKAILKRLKYGTTISDSGIRKCLKTASGAQGVSNFRPTAAAAIYDYFKAESVYDMSCGYGGRLLGAIISTHVKSYVGVDPCLDTYNGLCQLIDDFSDSKTSINIHNIGSEIFIPEENTIDLCFTSPPYFDTEKYSNEETQSYKKYPQYNDWLHEFVGKTIDNCKIGLKPGGILAYNVANTKKCPNLVQDIKELLISKGLKYDCELKLALSSIMAAGHKYEPILIFKR